MQKKITIYVVAESVEGAKVENGKSKAFGTKRLANEAMAILNDFGLEVVVFTEKRTVDL